MENNKVYCQSDRGCFSSVVQKKSCACRLVLSHEDLTMNAFETDNLIVNPKSKINQK